MAVAGSEQVGWDIGAGLAGFGTELTCFGIGRAGLSTGQTGIEPG